MAAPQLPKERLVVQTLEIGRPHSYEHWRIAVKAELVGRGLGSDEVNGYVAAIEDSDISDEQIGRGVAGVLALRAMDAALYAALLASISGSRKETVLNRLHATVRFGAGGLALRCLDREFQRSTKRAQVAATRELLNLAPEGQGVGALDTFLSRYRVLLLRAGADAVGTHAQIDILLRAAQGHPVLGAAVAAWRQQGSWKPDDLVERLEDLVAEARGMHAGGETSRAWLAAAQYDCPTSASPPWGADPGCSWPGAPFAWSESSQQWAPWAMAAAQPAAPARAPSASTDRRRCFRCGVLGHIARECPQGANAGAGEAKTQAELLRAVRELTAELRSKK